MLLQSRLPARQLASVTGSIISNMFVFGNVCKLMTKSLNKALDRRQGWDSCVDLDPFARKELEFWKDNVSNLNSRSFLNTVRTPSRIVYSDAGATGCAAFIAIDDPPVSHINWDSFQMNQSSTWRELHCVSFALKSFAQNSLFQICLTITEPRFLLAISATCEKPTKSCHFHALLIS